MLPVTSRGGWNFDERERRARFNSEEDGVSRLSRACTFKVEKKKKRKRKPFSKGRSFVEWQWNFSPRGKFKRNSRKLINDRSATILHKFSRERERKRIFYRENRSWTEERCWKTCRMEENGLTPSVARIRIDGFEKGISGFKLYWRGGRIPDRIMEFH